MLPLELHELELATALADLTKALAGVAVDPCVEARQHTGRAPVDGGVATKARIVRVALPRPNAAERVSQRGTGCGEERERIE